ncbi:nuclease-related domain-containing protein [Rhodoferax sp. U11-2br]|uniref:nuclease-related domain-containing protein n=1 Tax=Rhodoferax sp. U11-2br TaxID=2838878 RepID=UPI002036F6AB|nr:nuclease-related domain-containing protein [Rhodoferax sp. U11-2br]
MLEELQRSTLLDYSQKKWLREEHMRVKKGIQGEKDSAYYLDSYFKDGENHVLLHDLRFVVDGEVAQIDHLIINRGLGIYLIETKNYAGNLVINDQGEFTVQYDDVHFGIQSPVEQSHRHERILVRLLERLEIVGRTQKQPDCFHVVMFHPKARIQRPDARVFDTSNLIKADQFPTWHSKFIDSKGIGTIFKAALNMRSLDTVKEWGEKLMRQHRPADLLSLPDFMQPKKVAVMSPPKASEPQLQTPRKPVPVTPPKPTVAAESLEPAKKLICAHCGSKISYPEGKFCWNNTKRFGGLQYCRDHQGLFT